MRNIHTVEGGGGAGREGVTSTRRAGQSPRGGRQRQQQGLVTQARPSMAPAPWRAFPTPVTPKEKGREMAKCLLGLKFSNCYQMVMHSPLPPHGL